MKLTPSFNPVSALLFLVRNLTPLLLVAALLAGLLVLGHWLREQAVSLDRYQFAFTAIDCAPPPGLSREEFLAEVQYLGGCPDRINILENDVAAQLAEAFARHPWVEKVERVQVDAAGIRAELKYRQPVLAVRLPGKNELRAVDRYGVLLPANAVTAGLPIFPGQPQVPAGPAGTLWSDPDLLAAAKRTR